MRIIARFKKVGAAAFMSHLDLQRLLGRAFRRAGLPVAYSRGFNPHPRLSMGPALPVGQKSVCECFDIELEQAIEADDFMTAINKVLPDDIQVLKARAVDKYPSLMGSVQAAEYLIAPEISEEEIKEAVERALSSAEIVVMKRSKSGVKPEDIRPMILKLEAREGAVLAMVSCGNRNLNPALLLEHVFKAPGDITRLKLLTNVGGCVELDEMSL